MKKTEYTIEERNQLYQDLASWNGTKKQLITCIEKLSSLCVELCKYVNEEFNPDILPDIAARVADVRIAIEQITLYLKLDTEVSKSMQFKLDRMLMSLDDTSYLYLKGDE